MNADTSDNGARDDDVVAGEYALGVLSAAERDRVQRRMKEDAGFAARVAEWDERLQPMSGEVPEVQAPRRVWTELEASLFRGEARPEGLWSSLSLWRWLTVAASTAAAASLAFLLVLPPAPAPSPLVAALHSGDAGPTFLAKVDPASGSLVIRVATAEPKADKVPELWLIPEDGKPRSLGVIEKEGQTAVVVPADLRGFASTKSALAISLEPPGGSPTGQPTGPVIAVGKLQQI